MSGFGAGFARGTAAGLALGNAYNERKQREGEAEMSALMAELQNFKASGTGGQDGVAFADIGERMATKAGELGPEAMAKAHEFYNATKARRIADTFQAAIASSAAGNTEATRVALNGLGAFLYPGFTTELKVGPDGTGIFESRDADGNYQGGIGGIDMSPEGLTKLATSLTDPQTYWRLVQQEDQFNRRMDLAEREFAALERHRGQSLALQRSRARSEKVLRPETYDDILNIAKEQVAAGYGGEDAEIPESVVLDAASEGYALARLNAANVGDDPNTYSQYGLAIAEARRSEDPVGLLEGNMVIGRSTSEEGLYVLKMPNLPPVLTADVSFMRGVGVPIE